MTIKIRIQMSAPDNHPPKQNYKWPWFAAAAVVLAIVLAVVWVAIAAKKVEEQRDFTPLPSSTPAR
jgi:ABC-type maltose transport system permease subunit